MTLASRVNAASKKFQGLEVLSLQDFLCCSTLRILGEVISNILPCVQFPMDAPTRTKFQRFARDLQLSSFKKVIVSTPRLLHNLHMMSLVKAALGGLNGLSAKSVLAGEKLVATYSIST